MTKYLTFVVAIAFTCLNLSGQSKPISLVGAWRVSEVKTTGPGATTNSKPQPGLYLFTQKHYSQMRLTGEQSRPSAPPDVTKASAAELLAIWNPLNANTGTYEISGNILTIHAMVAKNPGVMASGSFQTFTLALEGNTLTLVSARNQAGPVANPTTVKLMRVE